MDNVIIPAASSNPKIPIAKKDSDKVSLDVDA